jgi:hypothetical protein
MSTAATAAAVAGGTALAAYVEAKYHIGKEVGMLVHMKRAERDYKKAGVFAACDYDRHVVGMAAS